MSDSQQAARVTDAAVAFRSALRWWRRLRKLSQQTLGSVAMGFDRSYISHVEAGRHPASPDFARIAGNAA